MYKEYQREIENCLKVLDEDGIILYPSETLWGIGCRMSSESGIDKIFKLKQRSKDKPLILLVSDMEMLLKYVPKIHPKEDKLIEFSPYPVTIIYRLPKKHKVVEGIVYDNGVAIRLVKKGFCHELIKAMDEALISTSANLSDEETPLSFDQINRDIIVKGVDYVVDSSLKFEMSGEPSKIVKLNKKQKEFQFLR